MTLRKRSDRPRFDELFEGIKRTLEDEGRLLSNLTDHQGEKGRLNETHLKTILRRYLPTKFGVGTGFIVSRNSFKESTGPQLDIVIYDALNNSPIYTSDAFSIFPVEMVYGYIEVKATIARRDIKEAFFKNRNLRALMDDKAYADITLVGQPPPRFYMFAYQSAWTKKKTLERVIREEFEQEGGAHAHGIYVLDLDMLVARVPRYDASIVDLKVWPSRAFPNFITSIVQQCNSMIPRIEIRPGVRVPMGLTLPLADMTAYLAKPLEDEKPK